MTEQQAEGRRLVSDPAIVVAAGTAMAYLIAFIYQWSYGFYFGLPWELIDVGIADVLVCWAFVLFLFAGLLPILNSVALIWPRSLPRSVARPAATLLMVLATYIVVGLVFPSYWSLGWVFPVGFAVVEFGLPLIFHRKEAGFLRKMEAAQDWDDAARDLPTMVAGKIGRAGVGAFLLACLSVPMVATVGIAVASKRIGFSVVHSKPECVVIARVGVSLVCATLDRSAKTVGPDFTVLELSNLQYTIGVEAVGPLKPALR